MRLGSRKIYAVLCALFLLSAGAWWWRKQTLLTPDQPLEAASTATAPGSKPGGSGVEADQSAHVTLPPDAPIDQMWATWQGPAQAGNSQAACRLAIETIRCAFQRQMDADSVHSEARSDSELARLARFEVDPLGDFRSSLQEPRSGLQEQIAAQLDPLTEAARKRSERCDSLKPEWSKTALELLRASALLGQPDAQTLYVGGDGWIVGVQGSLASPLYDQWTREAPLLLTRMLDAGHPEAPGLLAGAYSGNTWLSGLYPRDPDRAATYMLVNTRLIGKPQLAEGMLEPLSGEAKTRARASADLVFRQRYSQYQGPKPSFWLSTWTHLVFPRGPEATGETTPCEPPPSAPSTRATPAPSGAP